VPCRNRPVSADLQRLFSGVVCNGRIGGSESVEGGGEMKTSFQWD